MGAYYSDMGPGDGPVMYRDVAGPIEVFEDAEHSIPIGTARCIGSDAGGCAVWRLVVHDDEFEGPWVIEDREFLSTGRDWPDLYRSELHPELNRPRSASPPYSRRQRGPGKLRRTPPGVPASNS